MQKEDEEKGDKLFPILLVALLCIALLLMIVYTNYKDKGAKCIQNPMVYGVVELSKTNNADVSCICSSNKSNSGQITVDKTGMHLFNPYAYLN